MNTFTDFVDQAESDSGFAISVNCTKCKGAHQVSLSKIGWFAFQCSGFHFFGHVENWRPTAAKGTT